MDASAAMVVALFGGLGGVDPESDRGSEARGAAMRFECALDHHPACEGIGGVIDRREAVARPGNSWAWRARKALRLALP
ncbi:MAG: hypothetical protein M3O70_11790 [Actinomycetota bacterium]|nr:hypothetical protein [Actinomycetota bacterium]